MFIRRQMDKINFKEEFEKVARRHGMGEVISSSVVCHKARAVLEEILPDSGGKVVSFKNGLLTLSFRSSGALARFGLLKKEFLSQLNAVLKQIHVTELKIVLR